MSLSSCVSLFIINILIFIIITLKLYKMRHLLIKLFVLDYFVKVFGFLVRIPRTSTILYPIFSITGILIYLSITPIILWTLLFINLVFIFFSYIYFRLKPVKWGE